MVGSDAPAAASCRLEERGDGRYALVGEFGLEAATGMLRRGEASFRRDPRVEVDLVGVVDADSAGLAVMIEWTRAARHERREIVFRGVPRRLADLARIGGVDRLLPLAD